MVTQPTQLNDCRQVMILTADAGFGHRSVAKAIEAALHERHGDRCATTIVNPLREPGSPPVLQRLAEERHDWYMQSEPGLYDLGYRILDAKAMAALTEQVFSALLYDPLKNVLDRHQPDVVISTYPFYLEPLSFVFDRMGQALPLVSVITDLVTVHTLWFSPRVDLCLVPTQQARQKALRNNVPADRIHITGLPVHPRFAAETRSKSEIRADLGWDTQVPVALLVGGTRVPHILEIARLIDESGLRVQLAVIAGGDEKLHARLAAESWRGQVYVYGFVKNMPALMHASDLVLSKAGGLIVTETLACGRPLILFSAAGPEWGNVEYATVGGAGDWAPTPSEALASLTRWLADDGAILAERTQNARQVGRPHAVYSVVDLVWQLAETGPKPAPRELSVRSAARLPLKASTQVSRAIDKLEQDLRGVTDAELARLATWCVSQIETETELKRIADVVRQRIEA